jgi:hypothetical protein
MTGKLFLTCQKMLGVTMANDTKPAIYKYFERKIFRNGVKGITIKTARIKKTILYLFKNPNPRVIPNKIR